MWQTICSEQKPPTNLERQARHGVKKICEDQICYRKKETTRATSSKVSAGKNCSGNQRTGSHTSERKAKTALKS